jgi:RHS repeat-associated protein
VSGGTYDAANRQLTLGAKSMTYDDNGNLRTLKEAGQTTTYTWDARNRLTNIGGPVVTASFGYDATGRRTSKTIAGFSSTFLYDGLDIIKEIAAGQTVHYLRSLRVDETLARVEDTGSTLCRLPDVLGSSVALSDSLGGVPAEYTYEPFGRTVVTGTPTQDSFQYTGRENDGTGLYFYRARYYGPQLGRFVEQDPIGLTGGDWNLYAYAANNPVNLLDPHGLQAVDSKTCDVRAERWKRLCNYERELGMIAEEYACKIRGVGGGLVAGAPIGAGGAAVGIIATGPAGAAITATCTALAGAVALTTGLVLERDCMTELTRWNQAEEQYCETMAEIMRARGCQGPVLPFPSRKGPPK